MLVYFVHCLWHYLYVFHSETASSVKLHSEKNKSRRKFGDAILTMGKTGLLKTVKNKCKSEFNKRNTMKAIKVFNKDHEEKNPPTHHHKWISLRNIRGSIQIF